MNELTEGVQRQASLTRSGVDVRLLKQTELDSMLECLCLEPGASVFRDPWWHNVVAGSYGHPTRCWVAERDGVCEGTFAATWVRLPLLGLKCVAMPYQMHSGAPLASSESVCADLVRACIKSARADDAKYVEIRHFEPMQYLEPLGFTRIDSGLVTTTVPLQEELSLTQAQHGHRQRVRKAARLGLDVIETRDLEDWRLFRRMYLETSRSMGAPQAGWSFFKCLHELGTDRCRLYLAHQDERVVGGFLVVGDHRGVFARCSAHSSREALSLNAGQALWWRAMEDAAAAGCREFNCGISWAGDAGLIKWKEGWGGVTRPVYTYVLPLGAAARSAGGYFEGYGFVKRVWKHLPLPVVDVLGRTVTKWIG